MTVVSRRDWAIFTILILIAIFFRIYHLENIPAVCGDEAWTAAQAQLAAKNLPHTWFVTAQRFLSPFYIVLSYLSQGVEPFSIRYPAFVMGVLAVLFSFPLLMKTIGKEAAFLTTILIAVLPIHIEFSRLAWELCLVPISGLIFSSLILQKKWVYAIIALIAGTLCHPSFVLLTAVLVVSFFMEKKSTNSLPSWRWMLLGLLLVAGLAIWAFTWIPPNFVRTPVSLEGILIYNQGVAGIFTGLVSFATLADFVPPSIAWTFIILFYSVMISTGYLGWRKISPAIRYLLCGLILSIVAAYLAGGLSVVSPGNERASLFYCLPLCIFLGAGLATIKGGKYLAYAFSALLLGSTYFFLFVPVKEHGGKLSREFHTGKQDPKYEALEWIVKEARPNRQYLFVAEDYNIFWNTLNYTLAYLPGEIVMRHTSEQKSLHPGLRLHTTEDILNFMKHGALVISYEDGPLSELLHSLNENGVKLIRKGFKDYAGKDFIIVWKLEADS